MKTAFALPDALLERLQTHEADPHHIGPAREALEEALVFQFRAIARGLFAHRLLHGVRPDADEWWYQYASLREPISTLPDDVYDDGVRLIGEGNFEPLPGLDVGAAEILFQQARARIAAALLKRALQEDRAAPSFALFKTTFAQDVALRRVRAIAPGAIEELRIRVYGGEVDLWQEGLINSQLRDLGSSLRYSVSVRRAHRTRNASAAVGESAIGAGDPVRFLLGDAAPVSALGRVVLIDFERELAVSPYLGPSAGYAEPMKIVIRRAVGSALVAFIDPVGHELAHALTHAQAGDGLRSWHAVLRDDLCRYCRTPRRFGTIAFAFSRAFGFNTAYLSARGVYPPGEEPDQLPLHRIVRTLGDDGLLVRRDADYYCPLFEEGRRWHLA